MDALQMILLFDYYGELLTERQRTCFDLHYNQDLSLTEIAQELGVSRQGVHENIARAEALLQNMEDKTGCVRRDQAIRRAAEKILQQTRILSSSDDSIARNAADLITAQIQSIEE